MICLLISVLALIAGLADCGVFDFNSRDVQPTSTCQELNNTLYKYVDEILSRRNGKCFLK